MSNLSDDTLRRILDQIQTQAVTTQRSLFLVRSQIQSKEKERKILQLTMRELGTVPEGEGKMYKGVGKMFIHQSSGTVDASHSAQEKALNEELGTLSKRSKYLEKQFDEANSQLRDIFYSQNRER